MTDRSSSNDPDSDIVRPQTPDTMNSQDQDSAESKWQLRLLPFLVGTLIALTLFFCAAIAWETNAIQKRMDSAVDIDLRPLANAEFRSNGPFLLEANLIERRYRAANVAALSRIYLIFLGFGTGMVMALVGAAFILGKLSEPQTSIDGGGASFKASLRSGSPGVILAFFGTVLMLSTIYSKTEISVSDRAVYMGSGETVAGTMQAPETSAIPPAERPESKGSAKAQLAAAQTSPSATEVAALAKNEGSPAGVRMVMEGTPSLDGRYTLTKDSLPGTLSIHHQQVEFTGTDSQKMQVKVSSIDSSHVVFSVTESNGGRHDFDGFLGPNDDIVGQTSYHGSYWTHPYGFVATRIKEK